MSQTSIPSALTRGFAGQLTDPRVGSRVIDSRVSEEASAELPFGTCVARGAGNDGAVSPAGAAAAAKIDGVIVHSHAYAKDTELGTSGLKPKAHLSVLRKGRVLVAVEQTVVRGDRLRVRHTAGAGGTVIGGFRKDAVAGETLNLDKAAEVIEGNGGAGGLAEVEFNFDNGIGAADA